ncbi:MAG: pantoate--beta-alanine ligase, partial [Candidatus Promineifilaceae bacterium]
MIVSDTIEEARHFRWEEPRLSWGLVPTMGYLHEGHLSLVRRARDENDRVAVTIFVNPMQFDRPADLEAYPRDLRRDLDMLEREAVDLVFTPDNGVIYPPGFQTHVAVEAVTQRLEGAARPMHFQGVTTVVAKLLNIIQPDRAYFGQKDAQQVVVVKRMVQDLNFNLEVVVCPIIRAADGLALSSRNVRLLPEERAAAPILFRALSAAEEAIHGGQRSGDAIRDLMRETIDAEP